MPRGVASGIGFEFEHFRLKADHFQQGIDARPLGGADRTADGLATPVLRGETLFLELRLYLVRIGTGKVDLVDRDDDLDLAALWHG